MKFSNYALALTAAAGAMTLPAPAQAGSEPFLGQILSTPYNFCPRGTADASGQLISIAQNTALFALLGTTYGGNGTTTFSLPNLNGRAPISRGQGPGLPNYAQGQTDGATQITLTTATMPAHTHVGVLRAQSAAGNTTNPVRNSLALAPVGTNVYSTAAPANAMNAGDVNILPTGTGTPISSVSPYLVIRYCIAMQGVFPSRP